MSRQGSTYPTETVNPGQVGLWSNRPESTRPGQVGRVKSALYIYKVILCNENTSL